MDSYSPASSVKMASLQTNFWGRIQTKAWHAHPTFPPEGSCALSMETHSDYVLQ